MNPGAYKIRVEVSMNLRMLVVFSGYTNLAVFYKIRAKFHHAGSSAITENVVEVRWNVFFLSVVFISEILTSFHILK